MSDYGGAISLSHGRDHNNSDDDGDDDTGHVNKASKLDPSSSGKKPRGRPRGSKNKPKPPIVITRDGDGGMRPVVLEVAPGADVVEAVVGYARRNRVGISLLSGTGSVSNITLRHPMTHAPTLSLHGTYNLLCLCGSYLAKPNPPSAATFGLTVAGQQGQVFGGIVAGNVTAATAVVVVAATYVNPAYHRLPATDEEDDAAAGEDQPPIVAAPTPLSCQMSPDVMSWGPTSRPPY